MIISSGTPTSDAQSDAITLTEHAEQPSAAERRGVRGHKSRERRDIASGQVMPHEQLLRLAIAPDNSLVVDINAKLPGRGLWIESTRSAFDAAFKSRAFARSAKTKVTAPKDLADRAEAALRRSVLNLLGMGLRAGELVIGYDQVRSMVQAEPPAWRICASDAARDGRNKIRVLSKAIWNATPLLACFDRTELGSALGRDEIAHLALREGKLADKISLEAARLSGFCPLRPEDWDEEIKDAALHAQILRDEENVIPSTDLDENET